MTSNNLVKSSNPLENEEIKSMLDSVASQIHTKYDFQNWQSSFLAKFNTFLDSNGSKKAGAAYKTLTKSSDGLIKIVKLLQKLINDGNLGVDKTTVKARTTMSQLQSCLKTLVGELLTLMPCTTYEIRAYGFTKYHMGAVLVEDSFQQYAVMKYCISLLQLLRHAALNEVADKQILEQISEYIKKFDVFVGVMESLDFWNICKLAAELLHSELMNEARKFEKAAASAAAGSKDNISIPKVREIKSVETKIADQVSSFNIMM